jgi:polyisoprenoid-binding protein YceI
MAGHRWSLDQADGELLVRTGVGGPAARMGHRVTIAMQRWTATVLERDSQPTALDLVVDVASLRVLRGDGGLKPLSAPEKAAVRRSALRVLDARRYPRIEFHGDTVAAAPGGYDVAGTLTIHGVRLPRTLHVTVTETGRGTHYSGQAAVRQTDFALTPYSLLLGSLTVGDEVTVTFSATRTKTSGGSGRREAVSRPPGRR